MRRVVLSVLVPAFLGCFFLEAPCQRALAAVDDELDTIAKKIATRLEQKSLKRVAITDFVTLNGESTGMTKYLTDQFTIHLVSEADKFQVIDRNNIETLLKEHNLSDEKKGLLDQQTVRKLGKFAGVDAVLVGVATPLSASSMNLSIKVLDLETAAIHAAVSTSISVPEIGGVGGSSVSEPQAPGSPTSARMGTTQPASSKPFFQNAFLRVEVDSIGGTDSLDPMTLTLSLQNIIANEPIYIAAECCYGQWLQVSDNTGRMWSAARPRGGTLTELPPPFHKPIEIAPGDKIYVNGQLALVTSNSSDRPDARISITGKLYRLGANEIESGRTQPGLYRLGSGGFDPKGKPFTFGISNVSVGQPKPQLGIKMKPEVTGNELAKVNAPYGLVVVGVDPRGVAYSAGMQPGDVLEKIDGMPVRTQTDFNQIMNTKAPGDPVTIVYNRNGIRVEKSLRLRP